MRDGLFKGYWLVTNRCNLDCSYCVLEDAPEQLRRELDLEQKKDLVAHLHQLGFRRLTLSGGEVTTFGSRPPAEFLQLLGFLRTFRSTDRERHLEVELYTNGSLVGDTVAEAMAGVVDTVAVTIDSSRDALLSRIGRSIPGYPSYFVRATDACARLSRVGIEVKLHSVIGALNHALLPAEVTAILDAVEARGGRVSRWKFLQYMSYDEVARDRLHAIQRHDFERASECIARALVGRGVNLHFKGNDEMQRSLFNILAYGNAQYMRRGDTWSTSRRTRDLRTYRSMAELFASHDIDEAEFRTFHEVHR